MKKNRTYSKYSTEAAVLLGSQIKLGRKQLNWSETELSGRAGISRATLQKIEKGDMTCAIGLFFEVASLVRIPLFATEATSIETHINRINDKIALLPKATQQPNKPLDDDF